MIEVAGHTIGEGQPVFIISEIGTNFASIDEAREMVRASAEAGADAVKLQTYRAETVALPGAMFTLEDGSQISQYDFFKEHELSEDAHLELKEYACELGITLFSTPGHYDDVDLLEQLDFPLYKIGSDDLTNYPFLEYVAQRNRPMILSTGMCELGEIEAAVAAVLGTGNEDLALLHCTVGYPAGIESANLRAIETLRQTFGLPVGLSDHFVGETAAVLGVGLGAVVLEKHLTLDRSVGGPDNDVACEPDEFKRYVASVRDASAALGDGRKQILPTEEKWRAAGRKSIVADRDIAKGEILAREMLTIKRPSTGLHPQYLDLVVGRRARVAIAKNGLIDLNELG